MHRAGTPVLAVFADISDIAGWRSEIAHRQTYLADVAELTANTLRRREAALAAVHESIAQVQQARLPYQQAAAELAAVRSQLSSLRSHQRAAERVRKQEAQGARTAGQSKK
jgi:hypothetical protein